MSTCDFCGCTDPRGEEFGVSTYPSGPNGPAGTYQCVRCCGYDGAIEHLWFLNERQYALENINEFPHLYWYHEYGLDDLPAEIEHNRELISSLRRVIRDRFPERFA